MSDPRIKMISQTKTLNDPTYRVFPSHLVCLGVTNTKLHRGLQTFLSELRSQEVIDATGLRIFKLVPNARGLGRASSVAAFAVLKDRIHFLESNFGGF